ncbi:MAG: 50S ribosomal protein L23 [Oscillospiraceae bacterium]|nr:50S ribosomal protein L23 [Oscillospiraceae bacterium]MDE5883806.1 50S ribosomal protein L23 [Oscillospiraceae bacterium]
MKAPQDIIIRPIITEQSMDGMPNSKYTFQVAKDANKLEIKSAVEALFNVEVLKVNTLNCRGRQKRVGRYVGKTAAYKKAVVTINPEPENAKGTKKADKKKGTIEFFDGMF